MMTEQRFDTAASSSIRFSWREQDNQKSLGIETYPDLSGNLGGIVDIYLGDVVGGLPWRSINMGASRIGPFPGVVRSVTIIPRPGTKGIVAVATYADSLFFVS